MSRIRACLLWCLALGTLANGGFMLWSPAQWYAVIPGVAQTGPLNPHFVRDIGCAYLVTGGGLLGFALDTRARAAALASGIFLTLHALVHAWDALAGREHAGQLIGEVPTILLPAAAALWLAWPRRQAEQRSATRCLHG